MDITFATNRGRIAKKLRDCADGRLNIRLCLLLGFEFSLRR